MSTRKAKTPKTTASTETAGQKLERELRSMCLGAKDLRRSVFDLTETWPVDEDHYGSASPDKKLSKVLLTSSSLLLELQELHQEARRIVDREQYRDRNPDLFEDTDDQEDDDNDD